MLIRIYLYLFDLCKDLRKSSFMKLSSRNEHVCDPYAAMYTGVREWVINYWPDSFLNSERAKVHGHGRPWTVSIYFAKSLSRISYDGILSFLRNHETVINTLYDLFLVKKSLLYHELIISISVCLLHYFSCKFYEYAMLLSRDFFIVNV